MEDDKLYDTYDELKKCVEILKDETITLSDEDKDNAAFLRQMCEDYILAYEEYESKN